MKNFSVSDLLCAKLNEKSLINDLDEIKIKYALSVITNEGIKVLLLFFFFAYFSQLLQFLFCLFLLIPIRLYSGGLHMQSNKACFGVSFLIFFSAIFILPRLALSTFVYVSMLIISIIVISILSPVASIKRPFKTMERYIRCKKIAIFSSVILGIALLLLIEQTSYFESGVWIFVLQAFQLLIGYVLEKNRGSSINGKPHFQNSL